MEIISIIAIYVFLTDTGLRMTGGFGGRAEKISHLVLIIIHATFAWYFPMGYLGFMVGGIVIGTLLMLHQRRVNERLLETIREQLTPIKPRVVYSGCLIKHVSQEKIATTQNIKIN